MRILTRHVKLIVALLVISAGFMMTPFVLAAPPVQSSGPVAIVNTAYLNQRTGPGPEYVVQGIHAGGDFLNTIISMSCNEELPPDVEERRNIFYNTVSHSMKGTANNPIGFNLF